MLDLNRRCRQSNRASLIVSLFSVQTSLVHACHRLVHCVQVHWPVLVPLPAPERQQRQPEQIPIKLVLYKLDPVQITASHDRTLICLPMSLVL